MPIMAVFVPMRGASSRTSCSQRASASGSFIEVLLEDELGRHRIDGLVLHAAEPAFRLDRGEALVHALHRKLEAPLQAPREVFGLARHPVGLAFARGGQADYELRGLPLLDERRDIVEPGQGAQRMGRAQLRLAYG